MISFREYTSKQILCSVCGSLTVGEVSCSNAHSPMERPTRDKSIHSTAKEELRVTCRKPRAAALSRKWILSPQQSPGWHLDFNHLRGLNHTAGQLPGVGCRKAMGHHLLQVWGCYVWEVMQYTDRTLGICHAIIMWRWQAEGFYESPFPYIRWLWPPGVWSAWHGTR